MKLAFVGSGNVAWHLAPALENVGHTVVHVASRQAKNAKDLVKRLYEANIKEDLDFSDSQVEVIIIAVGDDNLEEVCKEIVLPENCVVAHTSGSKPLEILDFLATNKTGVFYPLQTFSKNKKVDLSEAPFLIESDDVETKTMLLKIGRSICKNVIEVSSSDRKVLHISAVFACNFTNHMLSIASDLLQEKRLDFQLIKPLIIETMNKALEVGPENAQTGPAKRFDTNLLEQHMQYLEDTPEVAEIYKVISQHIIDTYS